MNQQSLLAPDPDLAARYVAGQTTPAETMRVEQAMDQSAAWRALVGSNVAPLRLEENFAAITVELDAPKRGRIERLMGRLGMPDHVARLMAATPVMRRSWYLASFLVLFFGLAASNPDNQGSIVFFLALAPIVPVLGVGLAYGPGIDPAHDMTVATPVSGFRLLLLRSISVLATSVVFGGIASILGATREGLEIVAWLLPALALTTVTLALSSYLNARVAAAVTAAGWLTAVSIVANAAAEFTMFGAPAQVAYFLVALAGAAMVYARRDAFDVAEVQA